MHYNQIIEYWKNKSNTVWDSINEYELEIIKISDGEAIGKIIWRKSPYVTPQVDDVLGCYQTII